VVEVRANFALKMLARGSSVTVVDASEQMLAVLQQKARAAGTQDRGGLLTTMCNRTSE